MWPGRPYMFLVPLKTSGESALIVHTAPSCIALMTSALSAHSAGRGCGVSVVARGWAGALVTARPSRCHFSQPPSSTAALSKPIERSIHHRRVDHIMLPALYNTTCVPSPIPCAPRSSAKRAAGGIMKRTAAFGSDNSVSRSRKPAPGICASAHLSRPLSGMYPGPSLFTWRKTVAS